MGTNIFDVYITLLSFLASLYRSTQQMKIAHISKAIALPVFVGTMNKALLKLTCSVIYIYPY